MHITVYIMACIILDLLMQMFCSEMQMAESSHVTAVSPLTSRTKTLLHAKRTRSIHINVGHTVFYGIHASY